MNNSGVINNGFVIYTCTLDTNGERFKGLNSYNRISTHTTGIQGPRNEEIYLYIRDERLIRCSNTSTTISLNTNNPIKWERSSNDGQSWDNLVCTNFYYEETNPQIGKFLYRALNGDGTYTDIAEVTYIDAIPETINTLPVTNTKTVDETIVFTLELTDDNYNYQWYKNNVAIEGATSNTYSIDVIKIVDEGSYYCRVWNDCNSIDSKASTLTVNKAPQTITLEEILTKTCGDEVFFLPEKTDKGLTIVYQSSNTNVATVNDNAVTIKNSGTTTLIASQAGNQDYLSATTISRTLTVNKQNQIITFGKIPTKTYGDPNITLPATTDKGLTISYQSTNTQVATVATVENNILTIIGAGTTDIIATQTGDNYRYAATPITQALTVNKSTQNITFPNFSVKTYGDTDIILNQYSDAGLEILYASDNENIAIYRRKYC